MTVICEVKPNKQFFFENVAANLPVGCRLTLIDCSIKN